MGSNATLYPLKYGSNALLYASFANSAELSCAFAIELLKISITSIFENGLAILV